ncbi:SidA/IucD/PvdA family monooxygenase [Mucilaginibacter sp. NFX135]|uniref:SidA/IucD/PvdA family monooxygenase n=1 Tax=Mucilaginibacter sp. NFX135 TaxID=3402687 RepID=UPI003AFA4005
MPISCRVFNLNILHTPNYLYKKTDILQGKLVAIIGSGQSAGEVFQDLLPHTGRGDY